MLSKYRVNLPGDTYHASEDFGKKEEAGDGDTPGSDILRVSGHSTSKLLIHTDVC